MTSEIGLWPGNHFKKQTFAEEASLFVNIRGETRTPDYCEPIKIDDQIVTQAKEIGSLLTPISEKIASHLTNKDFREIIGVNDEFYEDNLKEFEKAENQIEIFGVDSVINSDDNSIKFIEINSRPQFLGRFDHYNSRMVGEDENSNAFGFVSQILQSHVKDGMPLIISHPLNAFHNYHRLLSQQTKIDIATLQDLEVSKDGFILYRGRKIDVIFRQFSMNSFMNPSCTKPGVIEAVINKKLTLINGPLGGRLGEKALLPYLGNFDKRLIKFLPEMEIITTGDGTDLRNYVNDWWLKTTTGGQTELTIRLTRKNITGWAGNVLRHFVSGDLEAAQKLLEDKNDKTAQRLKIHLNDLKGHGSHKWVLQKHIEPAKIEFSDENGTSDLNTTLRIYFLKYPGGTQEPKVFLEMLASKHDRVSGAGVTIPLKFQ